MTLHDAARQYVAAGYPGRRVLRRRHPPDPSKPHAFAIMFDRSKHVISQTESGYQSGIIIADLVADDYEWEPTT